MECLYSVDEVARFLVGYSNDRNKPISNLQLQKFLYFLWIEYYKKIGLYLFNNPFEAWKFGPVEPDVYYSFCAYGGLPIIESFSEDNIKKTDESFFKDFIDRYYERDPFELVRISHRVGHAWDTVFNTKGNRAEIPFDLIISKECA